METNRETVTHPGWTLDIPNDPAYADKKFILPWLWQQDEPVRGGLTLYTSDKPGLIAERLTESFSDTTVLMSSASSSGKIYQLFLDVPSKHARIQLSEHGHGAGIGVSLWGGAPLDDLYAWFTERWETRSTPPPPRDEITVQFTYMDGHGDADAYTRNIAASKWDDIVVNYPAAAAAKISSRLVTITPDDLTGGKIAVLYGPPGTGKTHLIRALCREWKSWARIAYIMDVDHFFAHASYMLSVLISDRDDSRWTVVVCEDAEEYLRPDAKRRVGQNLSKLLNAGDGMIGQGLKILFIFTTNADKLELNPAITRPGRCFAEIEIPKLSTAEASAWLGHAVAKPLTLAECYEAREATKVESVPAEEPQFGQYM